MNTSPSDDSFVVSLSDVSGFVSDDEGVGESLCTRRRFRGVLLPADKGVLLGVLTLRSLSIRVQSLITVQAKTGKQNN